MKKRSSFILAITALAMSLSFSTLAEDFRIATGVEGGGYHSQGKSLAAQIEKRAKKKES